MTAEERVESLRIQADDHGRHGYVNQLTSELLADIAKLRDRIDELGGYHDDV